jgi:hypothetical protein
MPQRHCPTRMQLEPNRLAQYPPLDSQQPTEQHLRRELLLIRVRVERRYYDYLLLLHRQPLLPQPQLSHRLQLLHPLWLSLPLLFRPLF